MTEAQGWALTSAHPLAFGGWEFVLTGDAFCGSDMHADADCWRLTDDAPAADDRQAPDAASDQRHQPVTQSSDDR